MYIFWFGNDIVYYGIYKIRYWIRKQNHQNLNRCEPISSYYCLKCLWKCCIFLQGDNKFCVIEYFENLVTPLVTEIEKLSSLMKHTNLFSLIFCITFLTSRAVSRSRREGVNCFRIIQFDEFKNKYNSTR